jgi:lipoic acid synthetase
MVMVTETVTPDRKRTETPKPPWLKVRASDPSRFDRTRRILSENQVKTVCDASHCPNISECWGASSATFLILGKVCTRNCGFCAVESGDPRGKVDEEEPARIANAVRQLGLAHVVVTSVTRDDLKDFGAAQFSEVVRKIRQANPRTGIELLIPDLQADDMAITSVVNSRPDVIGHNLETVRRLQPVVRDPRADYDVSLRVMRRIKDSGEGILTKSSLMLGLGETKAEVIEAMHDLRDAEVDALTLGQYLRPSKANIDVKEYVNPQEFDWLRTEALRLGFVHVAAGPFVRSSYRAFEFLKSRNERM